MHAFFSVQIIVSKNDERKWQTFFCKDIHFLFDAVIEKAELLLLEIRDKISLSISDGDRENYKVRINADYFLDFFLLLGRGYSWHSEP